MLDFPKHIDTISMGMPIVYSEGSQVEFSKLWCTSVAEIFFNLTKSRDPDEILPCSISLASSPFAKVLV